MFKAARESKPDLVVDHSAEAMKVEQFAAIGRPFRSYPPKELTEAETEYKLLIVQKCKRFGRSAT